jgi:hypothetical protein
MVGSAKYVDAFGAKHVTLACFTITLLPVLDYTKEGASNGIRGVQCPKYNCTDENCRRYGDQPAIAEVLKFLD